MKSPFYWNPLFFKLGLLAVHGRNLRKRYEYMAQEAGRDVHILEPCCGPALLEPYLLTNTAYAGFDLSKNFVEHCRRRGLDVWEGNAKDSATYCAADVVVLSDALHHITPSSRKKVIENMAMHATRKVIICDPFKDDYLKLLPSWVPGGQKILQEYYDWIELDGVNEAKLENTLMREELEEEMRNGFGVLPRSSFQHIENFGEDLIVTYKI